MSEAAGIFQGIMELGLYYRYNDVCQSDCYNNIRCLNYRWYGRGIEGAISHADKNPEEVQSRMILYTGDLHFGHKNVIGFDHRPFADVDEMDHVLIELWNGRVQPDDTVYILGDICYRSEHAPEWYLRQLKGHKILILGNHDVPILNNPKALHYLDGVEKMMHVQDGGRHICLCRFPIAEWNGYFKGAWHIYGHIHNRKDEAYEFMKTKARALNAGCMINHYTPASFNELERNNASFQAKDDEK